MRLKDVSNFMEKVGILGKDAYDLPTSTKHFPDGGWYRIEISGVERPQVLLAVIDEMNKRKIPIHRVVSVVMGATLLDTTELRDFAQAAHDAKLEVILTPGPRSAWDTGRQLLTPKGIISGLRFRGSDRLREAIANIMRLIDIGFRGFLVVDEGELWLLTDGGLVGRGYDTIVLNGKSLHSLFDTGAVHNYITKRATESLIIGGMAEPFKVGLGGETQSVSEICTVTGRLQDKFLYFVANVVKNIGKDERGQEIDTIFGATEMQRWNIKIDPKREKLDLSGFRKEFIEY